MRQSPVDYRMTDDHPNSLEDAGGQWLEGTDVPTFWVPAAGGLGVVLFVRAGEFDEPLALTGVTEIALRAAIAALPPGHSVGELRIGGTLSTIGVSGDEGDVRETLRLLAATLSEPREDRIRAELQRARARVDQRVSGLRELHLTRRFGSRGPGAADLPQYGPFKAEVADVLQVARRAFVDGNVALLVLGEEPPDLSFELRPGSRRAVPRPNGDLELPARMKGGSGGVSASMELPDALPGRLAFRLLMSRLETRGTSGDLAAGVEQVGDRDVIATIHAPVTDAFIETAGAAIVQETSAIAQTPPPSDELRDVSAAWLADASATPYAFGWFVVSQMLLGVRLESRADLVDRLWEIEPEDVSLSAGLMTKTMLLLLPDGAEIADELIPERGLPGSPERIQGTRYRPVGGGIGWAAHARGELFVGDEGVSQVTRSGAVHTVRFDDLELVIDYDDRVVGLVGSRSWLQVDPRLWRSGDDARTTILDHVPGDRVVPLPKGEQARLADELTIEHERQAARRNLGKAVAIAAGTLAFIGLLALWASGRDEPKPLANCAMVTSGRATPVDCSSADAQSRLLATMSFDGSAVGSCPLVTDDIVPMVDSVTDYACLRRLRPPHPGDPGRGGGVLRAGDCVADPAAGPPGQEAPCGSARNWATVSATAANPAHCPRPAVDYLTRPSDSLKPIVCLARGPGVLTPGNCVTDQSVTQLLEVGCGSPAAAFRVVARVAAPGSCASGGEPVLLPRALPKAAVACLRRH
jgi:hypothetical protein